MKNIYNSILLAAIVISCTMCNKEAEQPGESKKIDTIQASVASQDVKVSFSQGDAKLTLAWESTDKIMVVGNTTAEYSIASFDGHNATFTGEHVDGSSFDIYYPSSFASKEALMARSYTGQVQNGNGNMDHLQYNAIIEGAADYHSIVFERATGKKLNGVLKLVVKMPDEVTEVESISITAPSAIFYTTNKSDGGTTNTLSLSFTTGTTVTNHVLTAYIMTSMVDVTIPAETKLVIKVTVPGSSSYFQKTIHDDTNNISINGGQTLNIDIHDATIMTRKLAGKGTQASPYQIYNKYDMQVVKAHLALKNSTTETTYFELMNDVDMENGALLPFANGSTFYKIDFTSNDKTNRYTLKNAKVENEHYASIFGALNGKVHDVNFDNIQVTMTTDELSAVVCAYLGALADDVVGYVENVNITNSSVDHTYTNSVVTGIVCGNFARGQIKNVNIDDKCTVAQTITGTITEDCAIGGIAGITKKDVPSGKEYSIKNCVCSAKVDVKSSMTIKTMFGGAGILGQVKNSGILIDSTTFSGQLLTVAEKNIYHFGGIVAYNTADKLKITNCTNTANINITQHYCGGIIGRSTGTNLTITDCTNSGTITTTKNYTSGIAGEVGAETTISGCSNTSSINGATYVSGIVGSVGSSCNVSGCTNSGTVTGTLNFVAGIVAEAGESLEISSCSNTNNIQGGMNTAGVVGRSKTATITSCSNSGAISNGSHYIAGILAGSYNGDDTKNPLTYAVTISKCANIGSVTSASKNRVAGIVGDAGPASQISECFNRGTITGGSYVGGIVGALQVSTAEAKGKISDCYSISTVKVTTQLGGGIVGELYGYNDVYSCFAGGEVLKNSTSATDGRALGGIIGRAAGGGWTAAEKSYYNEIKYVVSWLDKIVAGGGNKNAGSGVVTGHNATKTSYTYCYRRADSDVSTTFTNCPSGVTAPVNQGQTTSNVTVGITNDTTNYPYWYPYHANTVNKSDFPSVSSVVVYVNSRVSNAWSTSIWDLSNDFPTLLNNPETAK